jgi:hypothetical protein
VAAAQAVVSPAVSFAPVVTARVRCSPLPAGSACTYRLRVYLPCTGGFRSRPVAGASGAPVLRDQGPIGRPGTARPMQALPTDLLLREPGRAGSSPARAGNRAGGGRHGVVRGCPLGTEPDHCEWHASDGR